MSSSSESPAKSSDTWVRRVERALARAAAWFMAVCSLSSSPRITIANGWCTLSRQTLVFHPAAGCVPWTVSDPCHDSRRPHTRRTAQFGRGQHRRAGARHDRVTGARIRDTLTAARAAPRCTVGMSAGLTALPPAATLAPREREGVPSRPPTLAGRTGDCSMPASDAPAIRPRPPTPAPARPLPTLPRSPPE